MIELGVKQVADKLHESLLRYIEAQYHVRDTDVIEERRRLLNAAGTIGQEPFIETTPAYELVDPYHKLGLPEPVGSTLSELAEFSPSVGVFPRPYKHQADALRAFFRDGKDLVVATGTGSGKTETFLFPLLGQLLLEGAQRPTSWTTQGIRALVLYPMNALVSDQLSRLRLLIGDERLATLFRTHYGRAPRFGMYTSRTPYPGVRTSRKDREQVGPLLRYFLDLANPSASESLQVRTQKATLVAELKARGRWPAKELVSFFGQDHGLWEQRLITGEHDRELLTRHEMQSICPDVLVTNYSMLEYMLVRPIERSLFRKTREWLASNSANQLTLVVDEAHMYRGVGGAEVALLIRRLQARFEVPRERIRCILTSASLGEGANAIAAGDAFACALTGARADGSSPFRVIQGRPAARPDGAPGDSTDAAKLAKLDVAAFFQRSEDLSAAAAAVRELAKTAEWPAPPAGVDTDESALRAYLFNTLSAQPVMAHVVNRTAGNAVAFGALAQSAFPTTPATMAESATTALLALGTYANDGVRPLVPTRAHLFFRGLPSLYACIDPHCSSRLHTRSAGGPYTLGRLYTEPRTHCVCDSRARVYEIFAHRDCGAVFLRVFGRGASPEFYWHERGGAVDPHSLPFDEHLLAVETPHEKMRTGVGARVEPVWIEIATGRVRLMPPTDPEGQRACRLVWRPRIGTTNSLLRTGRTAGGRRTRRAVAATGAGAPGGTGDTGVGAEAATEGRGPLVSCPNCTRTTGYKIMDLATKGEQPFANLVRAQLTLQPAIRAIDGQYPNGGRKVLLFSDGRQKAARLARDLPREVEFDTFRQALALSVQRLQDARITIALDDRLYRAFVTVCSDYHLNFFDQEGAAQRQLIRDCQQYRVRYENDILVLMDDGQGMRPPSRFRQALLRQLADPYYSLYSACAAVCEPSDRTMRALKRALADAPQPFATDVLTTELPSIAAAWIQALLDRGAFDPDIPEAVRYSLNEYFKPWGAHAKVGSVERLMARGGLTDDQIAFFRERCYELLTRDDERGHPYLVPAELKLRLAIDATWLQCTQCGLTQHAAIFGRCVECEADGTHLIARAPEDPYMTSRHDYIRGPLRAVLAGGRPVHVTAEEHTAQLSQRDKGEVYATTEEYELRFQDVLIDPESPPVDILSCTTTMEVGIDIGSLTAVGLRNVPPQRENYQQRAGRSGRRGSAVSTVVTYAQGGPHDHHYYANPAAIISGQPRAPRLKVDNARLAARHVHSYLVQTYFHETLDALGQLEESEVAANRTNVMSALGDAREFFLGTGDFSFVGFQRWLGARVLSDAPSLADTIAAWLPDAIVAEESPSAENLLNRRLAKRAFVLKTATACVRKFAELGASICASDAVDQAMVGLEDETQPMLLDALFDYGLLPSYAFPTSLAPFYVFGSRNGRPAVVEKPQQGKDKALSEYAPGRQLVIDKQTYRVGGIYAEDGHALNPGEFLFAKALPVYVSCPACNHVEVRTTSGVEPRVCPVCSTALEEHVLLDPPAFVPEKGTALPERDRNQEMSYATEAQFPMPVHPTTMEWQVGSAPCARYTYQENQELVIANRGPKQQGFCMCETCGAAWPQSERPQQSSHRRPYPITEFHRLAGIGPLCAGPLRHEPLYLGFKFRTDLLLIQLELTAPFGSAANDPWLHDALRSTAESLTIAAGRLLDIDPGDLAAGYRLLPMTGGAPAPQVTVELFVYDTAAGGAGYAAEVGEQLPRVLNAARDLAMSCEANCERSCTKCLRYYGNRFWHDRLDRHLASQLLTYALTGTPPVVGSDARQAEELVGLAKLLELEGWEVAHPVPRPGIPLMLSRGGARVAIGTYPALVRRDAIEGTHPAVAATRLGGAERYTLLNDYILSRDLPTAYQRLREQVPT